MAQLDFKNLLETETFVTVSELTRDIKTLLETAFPFVWLQAEISNFNFHSSGHMYFSLKDENAQIPAVMWHSNNNKLFFTPQDGMKVFVKGRISLYEKRGAYQFDAWEMKPAGIGDLQLAFEQLKAKLKEEGLFSDEFKQPIPAVPEKIAIVTSPTGAAIQDMLSVLRRRYPNVTIIFEPVRVQGEGAAPEIARALDKLNDYGDVDVLIVGRGGGSIEDLWPFNEEVVARAIFRSKIPVISAVGHEVDFSISDFVADFRAPTPSVAAELAVPDKIELIRQIEQSVVGVRSTLIEKIQFNREKLRSLERNYAFRHPLDKLYQHRQRLDELQKRAEKSVLHMLEICKEKTKGVESRLSLLEHRNVLKRGFTICTKDGQVVENIENLNVADKLTIEFYRGKVQSTVDEIS